MSLIILITAMLILLIAAGGHLWTLIVKEVKKGIPHF